MEDQWMGDYTDAMVWLWVGFQAVEKQTDSSVQLVKNWLYPQSD